LIVELTALPEGPMSLALLGLLRRVPDSAGWYFIKYGLNVNKNLTILRKIFKYLCLLGLRMGCLVIREQPPDTKHNPVIVPTNDGRDKVTGLNIVEGIDHKENGG
jgi:hypothetical protein